eukprot:11154979-Lingulodinium_polyedra.AAC.1
MAWGVGICSSIVDVPKPSNPTPPLNWFCPLPHNVHQPRIVEFATPEPLTAAPEQSNRQVRGSPEPPCGA